MNYEYDWDKIPTGSTFTAKINGSKCSGRISKEDGYIYLCQNKEDGSGCINKLGYNYSWTTGKGTVRDLKNLDVENLEVFLPEKGYKIPINLHNFGAYDVKITKNHVQVGCTPVSFEQVQAVYLKMKSLRK